MSLSGGLGAAATEAARMAALRAALGPAFDALVDSGVALAITDPTAQDDPIVYVNRAFEDLTGYRLAEVAGRNCRLLQAPGVDALAVATIAENLRRTGSASIDLLNQRRDGSPFWNRLNITTIRDATGAPVYRLATQADVSSDYVDDVVAAELAGVRRKLREAHERLRVVQAIAGAAGAWEWDMLADRLVIDARFASLYGLDPVSGAQGLPTSAFFAPVHEQDRIRLRIAVAGALHGAEVFARDYRLVIDGEERWVSARGRTFFDELETPVRFSGVLADITDQKRVEERLRVAQTAGGIGSFEYVSGYGTAQVSEQFCRLLGLQPADSLPVRTINAVVHPEDLPIIQGRDGQHPPGPAFHEFRIRRADTGEERWLASRGEHRGLVSGGAGFIGVLYDVTEAKHAQAQLQQLTRILAARAETRTEERNRVWNLSRDLLFVAGREGRFTEINPAWSDLLDFGEIDLIGAPVASLVHHEDLASMRARFAGSIKGDASGEFDCRVRARDGSFRWISWTLTLSGDALYGAGRDITQRRHLEDQLRQSQKMEAVGQLTGGIAHDFNNMLTGVLGGIDMVRRRLRSGRVEDVDRFLDAAMQSGERAAALTHRLLAFSRRQTLDSRPLDVAALAASMDDLLRRTLGEQIELNFAIAPDLGLVVADGNQLESAILNLAINARDAMPQGGRLTIASRNVALSDADLADSDRATSGDFVEIAVSDTGLGMSADVLSKVFDPFFTTKPMGQGTGLGLSMIYGFVQQSRGHIHVDSQEGEGTTIRLFLPRHAGEAALEAVRPPAETPQGVGQTILVVEDDPSVRLLVLQVLSELGYVGIETAEGRTALPILQSDRPIDLLITDVGLPGLNGRQVAEIARERRPDLPVLFMTGYAEQAADQAQFLEPGMEIITKPFAVEALGQRIGAILGAASS